MFIYYYYYTNLRLSRKNLILNSEKQILQRETNNVNKTSTM